MKIWLAALLVAICACGTSSTALSSTAASGSRITYPGASPSFGRYAVFRRWPTGVDIVDRSKAFVVASAENQPSPFHPNDHMAFTSASSTRLYYLDGGSRVAYLTPSGGGGLATTIALKAGEQAGFSVSPDDKRIAVAVSSYDNGFSMRLYVEDLSGGGNHVDVFSSTTVVEWPIGWIAGNLVLAVVHDPYCNQCTPDNPYGASSYHVVDPTSGRRLAALCSTTAPPQGPVEPGGVMCWGAGGAPEFFRWDGSQYAAPVALPPKTLFVGAALSPDGTRLLEGGSPVHVLSAASDFNLDITGSPLGWIDANHVVIGALNGIWFVDPRTGVGVELPEQPGQDRTYLGTLPAAIS